MPLKGTSYKRKYPTFQFLNEDIGFEWEIVEGEDWEEVQDNLKAMADKQHRKNNPHLYMDNNMDTVSKFQPLIEEEIKRPPKELQIKLHIDTINTYKDAGKLKQMFEKLANSHPEIKNAYDEKLKQLQ